MSDITFFNPANLIEEIKKRPGLYKCEQPADRAEKLSLWKEVGAAIYPEWDTFNKATAYDKVLQLQRKWRSLRDAYNRELRARKNVTKAHRKVYKYFRVMSFLGGYSGSISDEESSSQIPDMLESQSNQEDSIEPEEVLEPVKVSKKTRRKQRKRRSTADSIPAPEEMEMPMFPLEIASEVDDSDKLFMMSFLPEMRQLPPNLKMWVRAQIANVMQEAVTCHYTNTQPSSAIDKNGYDVKRPRRDSSE